MKVVLDGGGRFIPLETCKKNKNKQVLTHFYLHDGQSHKKIDCLKDNQSHMKYTFVHGSMFGQQYSFSNF